MIAVLTKIVSIFTSVVMVIINIISGLFGGATPPESGYERLELPEYYLGENVSTDIEDIVEIYNTAENKTEADGESPAGSQKIALIDKITADGATGAVLKIAVPVIENALEKNSYATDYIPARGALLPSDVETAGLYETEDGTIFVTLYLKDQIDGPDAADGSTTGPVARGIGTLGSIDYALAELGASISEGRETIKIEYTDAYIICEIDPDTGYIIAGTWHYDVNVSIGNIKVNLGNIKANIENLSAKLEYAVVI